MKSITLLCALMTLSLTISAQVLALDWVKTQDGGNGFGIAIEVDASGNSYVAGNFSDTTDFDPGPGVYNLITLGNSDMWISKLDASGNFVWARAMGGSANDWTYAMVLDAAGNIYMVGAFFGTADFDPGPGVHNISSAGASDGFIVKLDGAGNFLWARTLGGTSSEEVRAVALDPMGGILVAGRFSLNVDFDLGPGYDYHASMGQGDVFLLKVDASGNTIWAKTMGGPGVDVNYSVALDPAGYVYSTGTFDSIMDFDPGLATYSLTSAGDYDAFVSKYDSNGNFIWARQIGGTDTDFGLDIGLDAATNVYVAGTFWGTSDFDPGVGTYYLSSAGVSDIFLVKLDPAGNMDWAQRMGGTDYDAEGDLWTDAWGNTLTTGSFSGTVDFDPGTGVYNLTAGTEDIFLRKLDSTGAFMWAHHFYGTQASRGDGITQDLAGGVYTTGYYGGTVDFDPHAGVYNLTSQAFVNPFVHKLGSCNSLVAITASTCGSYTSPSGNYVWTTSGYYLDTLINVLGCDSIISVDLTVYQSTASSISPVACDSYISPSGNYVWNTTGTYMDTLTNAGGCDSAITVNLTIVSSTSASINPIACDTFLSPSGNHIWIASGTYLDTLINAGGCDSVITVNLTIPSVDTAVVLSSPILMAQDSGASYQWIYCDSVTIPGAINQSYTATASGNYAVIVTENGCSDTSSCYSTIIIATDDHFREGIKVFPNPTSGSVNIEFVPTGTVEKIFIRNDLGQLVWSSLHPTGEGILRLELGGPLGIYCVEIRNAEGHCAFMKIVKH